MLVFIPGGFDGEPAGPLVAVILTIRKQTLAMQNNFLGGWGIPKACICC